MCETREVVLDRLASLLRYALNCTDGMEESEVEFLDKLLSNVVNPEDESPFGDYNGTSSQTSSDLDIGNNGKESHPVIHNLEIIKVVVLIVVISIILFTTCRMVFQLFVRFRPEKSLS